MTHTIKPLFHSSADVEEAWPPIAAGETPASAIFVYLRLLLSLLSLSDLTPDVHIKLYLKERYAPALFCTFEATRKTVQVPQNEAGASSLRRRVGASRVPKRVKPWLFLRGHRHCIQCVSGRPPILSSANSLKFSNFSLPLSYSPAKNGTPPLSKQAPRSYWMLMSMNFDSITMIDRMKKSFYMKALRTVS